MTCLGSGQPVGAGSRCEACGTSFGWPHPANAVVGRKAPDHDAPEKLREGLRLEPAPALPRGFQIKCDGCRCSVSLDHEPYSTDCEVSRRERLDSQSDW